MPSNSIVAIKLFRSIALGEFVDTKFLTDPIEEKVNVLSNMGIMILFALVLLVAITLVLTVIKFVPPGKIRTIFEWLKHKLMWNTVIRYVLQSYLKFSVIRLIAYPEWSLDNT